MIKGRDIIIHLAMKYDGNWNDIYNAIKVKEPVSEDEINYSLTTLKSQALTIIDDDYPERLKKIYKPPFVLFYYGDLSLLDERKETLAIIGSREPTTYGQTLTKIITKDIVKEQIIIVSGLAKGIDLIAHQEAIKHQGKTIAILGSGIDKCYPQQASETYQTIKQDHLLISEYPNTSDPDKQHFPWRNRIIAGLADAIFVSDAKKRSGTLITVGYGLYLGKDIYVLPHHAGIDSSCNRLIKDGATLVESAFDILEAMRTIKNDLSEQPKPNESLFN